MRNLKRLLSLTLAAIMVLGMMVFGVGAVELDDFTDREEIHNDEAVLVLTTLGVINGKDDGSFDPAGNVTRGEMAKIICVILSGGVDPLLAETINDTYTDTVGHWASKYIEYCTTLGIIAGRGDGTFDPDGSVTISEAAKMLLVTLGYNATTEGYSGTAAWQLNVDARANSDRVGLYNRLTAAGATNTTDILTRENAAQMAYNALDVNMVTYNTGVTGDYADDTRKGTMLWEVFGVARVRGIVTANNFATLNSTTTDTARAPIGFVVGSHLNEGETTIRVDNFDANPNNLNTTVRQIVTLQSVWTNTEHTFKVDSGEDVLGREVHIFVKPARDTDNSRDAVVIGNVVLESSNLVLEDTTGSTAATVASDNGLNIGTNNASNLATQYVYNYGERGTAIPEVDGMIGVTKTIIDADGDGVVDYVLYNEKRLGKVVNYSADGDGNITISVDNGNNYVTKNKADIPGFENVSNGMYILTAFMGGRLHVQEAEKITGKLEAYKHNDSTNRTTSLTVAGAEISTSRVRTFTGDIYRASDVVDQTVLNTDATFYLDENGYIVAYGDVNVGVYKYAFVWYGEYSQIQGSRVRVTLSDTKATNTYNLSDRSDIALTSDIVVNGTTNAAGKRVFQVSTPSSGEKYDSLTGMIFAYSLSSSNEITLRLPDQGVVAVKNPTFDQSLTTIRGTKLIANNTLNYGNAGDDEYLDTNGNGKIDAAEQTNANRSRNLANKAAWTTPAAVTSPAATQYANNSTAFFYVTTNPTNNQEVTNVTVYAGRNNAPTLNTTAGDGSAALMALRQNYTTGGGTTVAVGAAAFFDANHAVAADKHLFVWRVNRNYGTYVEVDAFLNGKTTYDQIQISQVDDSNIDYRSEIPTGLYNYSLNADGKYTITTPTEAYYAAGRVIQTDKNSNTFILANGTEAKFGSNSILINYAVDPDNPNASLGTSDNVFPNDVVQVIMSDDSDRTILMVAIMERAGWLLRAPAGYTVATSAAHAYELIAAGTKTWLDDDLDLNQAPTVDGVQAARNVTADLIVTGNFTTSEKTETIGGSDLKVGKNMTIRSANEATVNLTANKAEVAGDVVVNKALTTATGTTLTVNGEIKDGTTTTNNLTVNGHVSAAKATLANGTVEVKSANSLIIAGDLAAKTLTIGAISSAGTYTGKVEANSVTVTDGIALNKGTLTVKDALTAASLTVGEAQGTNTINDDNRLTAKTVTVTGAVTLNRGELTVTDKLNTNNLTLGSATLTGTDAALDKASIKASVGTLTVAGTLTLNRGNLTATTANIASDITVDGDLVTVDITTVNGGTITTASVPGRVRMMASPAFKITVKGNASNVRLINIVPSASTITLDTSGVDATSSTANIGIGSASNFAFAAGSLITASATYAGTVSFSTATITAGIAITFSGEVTFNSSVTLPANATITFSGTALQTSKLTSGTGSKVVIKQGTTLSENTADNIKGLATNSTAVAGADLTISAASMSGEWETPTYTNSAGNTVTYTTSSTSRVYALRNGVYA